MTIVQNWGEDRASRPYAGYHKMRKMGDGGLPIAQGISSAPCVPPPPPAAAVGVPLKVKLCEF
jgi:hypothetical protein